jgi:hypothetical protein
MKQINFFSVSELKQPVNQYLCIAFLSVWCFWIVLYYFTQKTEAVADTIRFNSNSAMRAF